MQSQKEAQKNKIKKPISGLKYDLGNDKATKLLMGYIKWWLYEHSVEDKNYKN